MSRPKTNTLDAGLSVMREVLTGELDRQAFGSLRSRWLKVHAAVAYMLANPDQYLLDGLAVKEQYEKVLAGIIGEPTGGSVWTNESRQAGLHRTVRNQGTGHHAGWKVTLIPPPQLIGDTQLVPESNPEARANLLFLILSSESAPVLSLLQDKISALLAAEDA